MQYLVRTCNRRESEKNICMSESFCSTSETNTILWINSTLVKQKHSEVNLCVLTWKGLQGVLLSDKMQNSMIASIMIITIRTCIRKKHGRNSQKNRRGDSGAEL